MSLEQEIIERAASLLRDEIGPRAQEIDLDREALRWAMGRLCSEGMMGLRLPEAYGGPEISERTFRSFQEAVARTSGALAFLQTQHQSAGSMLSKSPNEALKAEYLPRMGSGERQVGIGFSQLRRGGPPLMRATPVDSGYILKGHVPWVTGWSFYPEFLIGATLPDGQAVFGIVPLANVSSGEEPRHTKGGGVETQALSVRVSPPMKLAAMESAMTVTVDFENFLLVDAKVAFVREAGWIRNNDQINIALQGHFALGCAQAGLDILLGVAEKKGLPFVLEAHTSLAAELEDCRRDTEVAQKAVVEEATTERLRVRAWAIDLAVRCAHAAVTASSGAANSLAHPAQRVYREALVYTVSAQTPEIMEATLLRLRR